jgi:hypothetical protein
MRRDSRLTQGFEHTAKLPSMMLRPSREQAIKSAPAVVPTMDVKGSGLGLWLARCWPLDSITRNARGEKGIANKQDNAFLDGRIGRAGNGRKQEQCN